MQYTKTPQGYLIRFIKGEELPGAFESFCESENIKGGFFHALGAVTSVELACYHLDRKEYTYKKLDEELEIVSLTGNVAIVDNKPVIHMHGVVSDKNFQCFGGHVKSAVIGATCEMYITDFEKEVTRKMDEEIGLKLLHCEMQKE